MVLLDATAKNTVETKFENITVDTCSVVIKVCLGPPGEERNEIIDYVPTVCAYCYENQKLIMYQVTGFDLVYQNDKAQTVKAFHINGNTFNTVRSFLITVDSSARKRVFLDNVSYIDSHKDTVTDKGFKQLFF